MKTPLLIAASSLLLTGCIGLRIETDCSGLQTGPVKLHYGDSELQVTPRVQDVYRRGNFSVLLLPRKRQNDPDDYDTVLVSIVGKTDDPDNSWIELKSGNAKDDQHLTWCVPEDQEEKVYSYKVTVDKVGVLDPRVNVKN